ncbi:MAG: hypothetical protein Q8902_00330 [Bacteroidota bacterium]|nr:hypothetical protein [Bacteroidota bacterium]MDP4232182.1 hypothetical protein [Bacteroidota bacterium]MDP4241110.1 hypothetical protein [Bacteroidota bacterium]
MPRLWSIRREKEEHEAIVSVDDGHSEDNKQMLLFMVPGHDPSWTLLPGGFV